METARKTMSSFWVSTAVALLLLAVPKAGNAQTSWINNLEKLTVQQLIITPGNHQAFIDAISSPDTKSLKMSMFHLTDMDVVNALLNRQKQGNVDIQIILDRGNLKNTGSLAIAKSLSAAGIKVVASTPIFSITHTKYMLINDKASFVTAINLTNNAAVQRDFGVVVMSDLIAKEILSVFLMDQKNGDPDLDKVAQLEAGKASQPYTPSTPGDMGPYTPELSNPNLVWSPVNSQDKLVDLINSSTTSLILTVENLRNDPIQQALVAAAARGVDVKVIVPQADMNSDPNFNLPALLSMQNVVVNGKTVSVNSRMMPGPMTAETPYMHSKMIVVDQKRIYIGSENFSYNSLKMARELGIVFEDEEIAAKMGEQFVKDWGVSNPPGAPLPVPPKPASFKKQLRPAAQCEIIM